MIERPGSPNMFSMVRSFYPLLCPARYRTWVLRAMRPGSFTRRLVEKALHVWKEFWGEGRQRRQDALLGKKLGHRDRRPSRNERKNASSSPRPRKNELDTLNPRRRDELMRKQLLVDDEKFMQTNLNRLREEKAILQISIKCCGVDELYENQSLYSPYALSLRKKKDQVGAVFLAKRSNSTSHIGPVQSQSAHVTLPSVASPQQEATQEAAQRRPSQAQLQAKETQQKLAKVHTSLRGMGGAASLPDLSPEAW